MANRLANATSPYLLQHADNPVDWWPWTDAAFDEARRRDVPILLSVGYAACHWCHVMAHESFEDPQTAQLMNENFVNIKVDREERPDVDAVYMEATQAMTGQGGWPMTVFMTPEGKPFYCGTYFPPTHRFGMPGFRQILVAIAGAWRDQRAEIEQLGGDVVRQLDARLPSFATAGLPTDGDLAAAVRGLEQEYDQRNGGFGSAPKFPPSMILEFLLRHHARTGSTSALNMVAGTGGGMARGGMYDQLAGGFARYSVDATWTVPHFEKMLYDNALLVRVYVHWWRATGEPLAERITIESVDWMLRDLRTPEGGFASALDADSEGVEGKFYVWTPEQLREALGPDDGAWAAKAFGVTEKGTFEHGTSVLQRRSDPPDLERYERVRAALLAARARRTPPARDEKIVAAWNGLAIAAVAEAGALLDRPDYVQAAIDAAELLISLHVSPGGRLVRTSRNGEAGPSAGVLEDYAGAADGLLELFAVTGEARWFDHAGMLLDALLTHFTDENGELFDTADDVPQLIRRPRDPTDNATPSGRSAAAAALLTYAAYTGSARHREAAERALRPTAVLAARAPRFIGWGMAAAEALLDGPREIAVVGPSGDAATRALHRTALLATAPGAVVAVGEGTDGAPAALLRDRSPVRGRPAAYVCRNFVCDLPTTDPAELAAAVGARAAS